MPVNVNDKIRGLPAPQRRKVEARAAELMAEEMTLRELRKARKLTQVRLAKTLKINQDSVSRLEKRSDLLLSTLRKAVEAMGGTLSLVAEFPDRRPCELGIAIGAGKDIVVIGQREHIFCHLPEVHHFWTWYSFIETMKHKSLRDVWGGPSIRSSSLRT